MNFIFISILITVGYLLYIKDIEVEISSEREDLGKNLIGLLIYTSPIYIPVIVNLITGWPFYLTLLFSVLVVYVLSNKEDFIKTFFKSISWHTVLTVAAILMIKEIILRMDSLLILFTNMFNSSENILYILAIFFISSIFFGFITGNQGAALAIILPMLAQLDVSIDMLYVYIFFAYGSSFMGYFFSPVHL